MAISSCHAKFYQDSLCSIQMLERRRAERSRRTRQGGPSQVARQRAFLGREGPHLSSDDHCEDGLSTDKWGVGPSVVALTMLGHWVVGAIANNIWSVAGDEDRADVSTMLIQYFVNYNLPGGWYLTSSPIITADWEATSGNKWVVPFGGGAGKVVRVGKLPVNASAQAYYNVVKPESFGADWTLRATLQLLFPK